MTDETNHLFPDLQAAAKALAASVLAASSRFKRPMIAAVDGGSGAGKSTLTRMTAPLIGASVIHYDDFFDAAVPDEEWDLCPDEQKCRRCMDWIRLRREVLEPLLNGQPARYRPYSFETEDKLAPESVIIQPSPVILLDGIYSALPELNDLLDYKILIQVPDAIRHRRHNERENSEDIAWHRRWDPSEAYYFAQVRPPSSYDLVIEL
ncbi:uridine kinase family protein [Paenibacillus sacheonensis]|uniref:Phosphoribulokinase/uridine kinase domain-containing protein n=1 Tax=Paenibacillus sacheonensis TaxID=742054 RepID=A0A7X4YKW9_9BACL|nr:hypothetical protein [Paenibacillus sacheonensis]MBM7563167.1 uridine kinase [Paenibacillus sacheonensis]NBC68270.1 hypothetical protein [Paenibacillus sacheonensis]